MRFLFGDYSLDADRRELRRGTETVHVEPQVFDLLLYLIRHRDKVVSKDDLIANVWQGRVVSESTLSTRVNAARHAIGDSGERQQLIRTIARRGVRFVGDVREDTSGAPSIEADRRGPPDQDAAALALPLPDKPSIAVLPFANMSDDPQQEYFADGMADEIITALSRCGWLFVIARNSSFIYKGKAVDVRQVGRELGVRYVLEGSVRRAGNRLRFVAQLIEAASGAHIWADRFEGELRDVFELQDRITESVVGAIEPKLQLAEIERLKQKPAANLDAYDCLLRAQQQEYLYTEESLVAAIRLAKQALAIDPDYARAMAFTAHCYGLRVGQGWTLDFEHDVSEGVRFAQRAIELEQNDANVAWMAAWAIWNLRGDAMRARDWFSRSLSLNPNSAMALTFYGMTEGFQGHTETAVEMVERGRRLSPRDPRGWMSSLAMAVACNAAGRFAECAGWAERALAQNPRAASALRNRAGALIGLGRRQEAIEAVKEMLRIDPTITISGLRLRAPFHVTNEKYWNRYMSQLREAGLPE
jgi:TolB-like protein/Tfp pilus assembly protein PilF